MSTHTHVHSKKHGAMIYYSVTVKSSLTVIYCIYSCCNTIEVYSYLREVFLRACPLLRLLHKLIMIQLSELKVSQQNYLLFQSHWYYSLVSCELCSCESMGHEAITLKIGCASFQIAVLHNLNYSHHGWLACKWWFHTPLTCSGTANVLWLCACEDFGHLLMWHTSINNP